MERILASFAPELDLPVISNILQRVDVQQLLRCAPVNSNWRAAVAAEDKDFALKGLLDATALQTLLRSHVRSLKSVTVGGSDVRTFLVRPESGLPGADFSQNFGSLTAATRLVSVSLNDVYMAHSGRNFLAALASLPALQHLSMRNLHSIWVPKSAESWAGSEQNYAKELYADRTEARELHEKLRSSPILLEDWESEWAGMSWAERNNPQGLVQQLTGLRQLELEGEPLLFSLGALTNLQQLKIIDFSAAAAVKGLSSLAALQQLQLPCRRFYSGDGNVSTQLAAQLSTLQHLSQLHLTHCERVPAQPGFGSLTALRELQVSGEGRVSLRHRRIFGLAALASNTQMQRLHVRNFTLEGRISSQAADLQAIHFEDCNISALMCTAAFPATVLPQLTSLLLSNVTPELLSNELPRAAVLSCAEVAAHMQGLARHSRAALSPPAACRAD